TESNQYLSEQGSFEVYEDTVSRYYDEDGNLLLEIRARNNNASGEKTMSVSFYNGEIGRKYGELRMKDGSILSIPDRTIQYKIKDGKKILQESATTWKVEPDPEEISLKNKNEIRIYEEAKLGHDRLGNPIEGRVKRIKNVQERELFSEKTFATTKITEWRALNEAATKEDEKIVVDFWRSSYPLLEEESGREKFYPHLSGADFSRFSSNARDKLKHLPNYQERYNPLTGKPIIEKIEKITEPAEEATLSLAGPKKSSQEKEIKEALIPLGEELVDYKNVVYDVEGKKEEFSIDLSLKKYQMVSSKYGLLAYEYLDTKGRTVLSEDPMGNIYFVEEFLEDEPEVAKTAYLLFTDSQGKLQISEIYRTDEEKEVDIDKIRVNGEDIGKLDGLDKGTDYENAILEDVKKMVDEINREMGKPVGDYHLIKIEVETRTGEKYYKYVVPGDRWGRAVITIRGDYLTVVTEWNKERPQTPMNSYLVNVRTGKTSLYIDNADAEEIFVVHKDGRITPAEKRKTPDGKYTIVIKTGDKVYELPADEKSLIRVRIINPNTKEVWYRWYRPVDLLGRWEYEEKGIGDIKEDFSDPDGDGYYDWNPKFRTYIGKWSEETKRFENKYVPGTDIAENSELYYISKNLKSHKDWNSDIGGVFAWRDSIPKFDENGNPVKEADIGKLVNAPISLENIDKISNLSNEKKAELKEKFIKGFGSLEVGKLRKVTRTLANGHTFELYNYPSEPIRYEPITVDDDRHEVRINLNWQQDPVTHSDYYATTVLIDKNSVEAGEPEIMAVYDNSVEVIEAKDVFDAYKDAYEKEFVGRSLWDDLNTIDIFPDTKIRVVKETPRALSGSTTTEVHYSENKAPTKTIYINPHDPLRSELAVEVPKGENGE
ncbi:MAG: hypothetical protein J7J51_03200, partial [Candidatus Omnitrophica bacterium]|nr:hypothetical protein [Candidatus Omnitrophota bacterium]